MVVAILILSALCLIALMVLAFGNDIRGLFIH